MKIKTYITKQDAGNFVQGISPERTASSLVDAVHNELKKRKHIRSFKFQFTKESFGDLRLTVSDTVKKNLSSVASSKQGILERVSRDITSILVESIESFAKFT